MVEARGDGIGDLRLEEYRSINPAVVAADRRSGGG
jgi:hypothetical protein